MEKNGYRRLMHMTKQSVKTLYDLLPARPDVFPVSLVCITCYQNNSFFNNICTFPLCTFSLIYFWCKNTDSDIDFIHSRLQTLLLRHVCPDGSGQGHLCDTVKFHLSSWMAMTNWILDAPFVWDLWCYYFIWFLISFKQNCSISPLCCFPFGAV